MKLEGQPYNQPKSERELEILAVIARLKSREIELEGNYSRRNDAAIQSVRAEITKLEAQLGTLGESKDNSAAA